MNELNFKEKLWGNIDFKKIANDPNFKEDSVREVIILPVIKELGYKDLYQKVQM